MHDIGVMLWQTLYMVSERLVGDEIMQQSVFETLILAFNLTSSRDHCPLWMLLHIKIWMNMYMLDRYTVWHVVWIKSADNPFVKHDILHGLR